MAGSPTPLSSTSNVAPPDSTVSRAVMLAGRLRLGEPARGDRFAGVLQEVGQRLSDHARVAEEPRPAIRQHDIDLGLWIGDALGEGRLA